MKLDFKQVDVFTQTPFKGNPLAIVFDADSLTDDQLQTISTWTNLSETLFFLTPTDSSADYRVRIFTPGGEVPFAGHPTLGLCHAFKEHTQSTKTTFIQQCEAGLVNLELQDNTYFFQLPRLHYPHTPNFVTNEFFKTLDIKQLDLLPDTKPTLIDVGPRWFIVQLQSADKVLSLTPDMAELKKFSHAMGATGCCCFGKITDGQYETRTFAPVIGVDEDPVCGSGAGAIGVYLQNELGKDFEINLKQGQKISRDGELKVIIKGDVVKVGGGVITIINGTIDV